MMRTVAILCAARKTAYWDIPDVEVYDEVRDARTFPGGIPVIAHPPCRRWTSYGKNMLKGTEKRFGTHPDPDDVRQEKQLGLWCAEQVQENGGILEQPAKSELWSAAGLPMPGSPQSSDSFSLAVWQSWWGFPCRKATWFYFRGISMFSIEIPFRLLSHRQSALRFENHKFYRSHTVPALAQWLVDLARTAAVTTPRSSCHKRSLE
jgi:hypothetical protein